MFFFLKKKKTVKLFFFFLKSSEFGQHVVSVLSLTRVSMTCQARTEGEQNSGLR